MAAKNTSKVVDLADDMVLYAKDSYYRKEFEEKREALVKEVERLEQENEALRKAGQQLAYALDGLGKGKDAEIAALQKDAERLDFMSRHGKKYVFAICDEWYTRLNYGMPYKKHKSLREAIDAARGKQ